MTVRREDFRTRHRSRLTRLNPWIQAWDGPVPGRLSSEADRDDGGAWSRLGLLSQRLRLNRGTGLGSGTRRDRGESERWSGGIAQLDTGALSHECLARDGTVDEHAVATLAAHGPPGWGGGHQQVRTRHEGVDDLNVAVRCPSHGEGSGEGVRFQRGLGRERAHDECGNGQGAVLPGRVSWDSRHDTAVSMSPLKVSTPQCDVGYV